MIPIVAFIGASGSGKTRLISRLIGILRAQGYRIGAIKHIHHRAEAIELDRPEKDSHRLRKAGADPVLLVGPELRLKALVERYCADCDLVLAEGFSSDNSTPKIVVERSSVGEKPSVWAAFARGEVIAWVSDNPERALGVRGLLVRHFSADEPRTVAAFLQERFLRCKKS